MEAFRSQRERSTVSRGWGRRSSLGDGVKSDDINQVRDSGCSTSFEVVQEVAMGGDGDGGAVRSCISDMLI